MALAFQSHYQGAIIIVHCENYVLANLFPEYYYCKQPASKTFIQLDCSVLTRDAWTPMAVLFLVVLGFGARCPSRALNLLFSASS